MGARLKSARERAKSALGVREFHECCLFIDWTKLVTYHDEPLFERVVKIPNERGKAGPHIALLQRIGMRKGFPDYIVLAPLGAHAGLMIEAKRPGGRVEPEQVEWRDRCRRYGYRAEICDDGEHMIAVAREYFATVGPPVFVDRVRL